MDGGVVNKCGVRGTRRGRCEMRGQRQERRSWVSVVCCESRLFKVLSLSHPALHIDVSCARQRPYHVPSRNNDPLLAKSRPTTNLKFERYVTQSLKFNL